MSQTKHRIICRELGPMENFVYLIHDLDSQTAALVDPAWEVDELIDLAARQDIRITDILLTHSHHDHTNGLQHCLEKTDARVHLMKAEAKFWGADLAKPVLHHGGDTLQLGQTEIHLMHTPGHTPGSACFHVGNDLIAGDTLFVFGCGRCDMSGGDPEQMFHSLKKIRSTLPATTVLHPGHNYAPQSPTSTLQAQSEGNPFLHFDNSEDFSRYRMQIHDRIRETPYQAVSREQARHCLHHPHEPG